MNARICRRTLAFPKWKPTARDQFISYTYTYVDSRGVERTARGGERWMRALYRIAAAALATGATEFKLVGSSGSKKWQGVVTCTEEQADAWFKEKLAQGHFMLMGEYKRALLTQARRRAKSSKEKT